MLFENARDRRDRLQSGRPFADGRAPRERPRDAGAHSATLRRRGTGCTRFPTAYVPYDLDISPDGRLLSASVTEVNGDQFLRVWEIAEDPRAATRSRSPSSASGSRSRRVSCSPRTGATCTAAAITRASRTSSATRSRPARSRRCPTRKPGSSGRCRSPTGGCVVLNYTAEGFVPATIEPRPIEDVSAITFLGAEVAEKYPVVKTWQVPPASTVDDDKVIIGKGPVPAAARPRAGERVPGAAGLQGLGGHRLSASTSRIRSQFAKPRHHRRLHAGPTTCRATSAATWTSAGSYLGWRGALSWNRSDFYDLFGPTKRSRKGYAAKLGYDWLLIWDEPRRLDSQLRPRRTTTRSTRCRTRRTSPTDFHPPRRPPRPRSTTATCGARSARSTTRRASRGSVVDSGNRVNGRDHHRRSRGSSTSAVALPDPALVDLAAQRRRRRQRRSRQRRSRTSTSAASATTTSTTARSSAIASTIRCRASASTRSAALSFVREMVEWNLPPVVFESVGTPGFHLNWLRPAVFVAGTVDRSGALGAAQGLRRTSARQVDLRIQRAALVRHDAVGRLRGRLQGAQARRRPSGWSR